MSPFETGAAISIGAGVARMDEHAMDGMVGGHDPAHLATQRFGVLQREQQIVRTEPQPDPPRGTGLGEAFEDGADRIDHRLVGMEQDLAVGLAPDKAGWYTAAQFAAGRLVTNPAVQPGAQNV